MLKANKEENLNETLTCFVCKKYYLNPVILPCGKNICGEHIDQNSSDYKCLNCNSNHVVPENGFSINETIVKISRLNIHLDEKTKYLHEIIDEFDTVVKELSLLCKDPDNFIFDYVSATRFKIDLEREKLIERIHKISEDMLGKLKVLEDGAKTNAKKLNDLIDRNQLELDKLEQLSEKWKKELRTPKLEQNRVDDMLNETRKYLSENQEKAFDIKNKVLSGNGCYFEPKNFHFNSDSFGQLVLDKFELTNSLETKKVVVTGFDSNILTTSSEASDLLKVCEFDSNRKLTLVYRASRDGFSTEQFHAKCDKIPKTLSIIKARDSGNVFGGYTQCTWNHSGTYKQDNNAFIFSLVNKDNKPIKMKQTNPASAIFPYSSYHITFGAGHDFKTATNSNTSGESYSNLGNTYKHPTYQYETNEAKNFLAGSYQFYTSEIEVFRVD